MRVDPQWLSASIGRVLICDAGWGPDRASEHIPGAIRVDTDEIEADETRTPRNFWNLIPGGELIAALENMGIARDTTVVVYGAQVLAAARFAWALEYAGVRDVHFLDGGLHAWRASGGAIETAERPRHPRSFGARVPLRPEYRMTVAEARERLGAREFVFADVRSRDEFLGRVSGYSYIHAKGRIPGALWAHGGPNSQFLEEYHDAHGRLRSPAEVAEMWRSEGIDRGRKLAFYCGTGWRASLAFLFARWMGFEQISVLDGGWLEWTEGRAQRTESSPAATLELCRGTP